MPGVRKARAANRAQRRAAARPLSLTVQAMVPLRPIITALRRYPNLRSFLHTAAASAAFVTLAACGANTPAGALPPAFLSAAQHVGPNVVRACSEFTKSDEAHCLALVRTDKAAGRDVAGYGPSDLQSAYSLPSSSKGKGQTIAI